MPSRILLDCVQKMTEVAQREDENDGADNESLASDINSTGKNTMQITTSDSMDLKLIKRFMFHKVKKREMQP